ncbi:MAG: hypothetical protein KGL16_07360, partial [Acidobacteriota bacterium]|nr:hypothetical protein [Acidobacteriota bacterium]
MSRGPLRGAAEPLRVINLFNTLPELARLAAMEIELGAWLDAYLLSAGISQILDDYLQPDPYSLRRAAAFITPSDGGAMRAVTARILERSADTLDWRIGAHAARALRATVARGLDRLADRIATPCTTLDGQAAMDDLERTLERIAEGDRMLPRSLQADTVRLPSCFRSFDQHPMDLHRLVRRVAEAHPNRHQPIVVVGVRTSGSYLAPICAACLRVEGYADVHVLTMRPGRRAGARERAVMRRIAGKGLVLVCDDPPVTGNSMAAVA